MIRLSQLLQIGTHNDDIALNFANRMFNISALILGSACAFYAVIFLILGNHYLGLYVGANALVYAICLTLSFNKFFTFARLLMIHCFNSGAAVMVLVIGYDSGLIYLFFFIISASSFFIVHKEVKLRVYCILLPLLILFALTFIKDIYTPIVEIPKALSLAFIVTIFSFFVCTEFWQFIFHNRHIHQLRIAREEAEKLTKVKTEFLSTMSHEIQTPINAIVSMGNFLNDESLSKKERNNFTETLNQNCQTLMSIVDNIMDYSQLEDPHGLSMYIAKNNLNDTSKKLDNEFKLKCSAKELKWTLSIDSTLENNHCYYDEKRIYQILSHIIDNAVKFTSKGAVTCNIEQLSMDTTTMTVRFTITDTGIGIDREKIIAIDTPFNQGDNSLKREFSGLGLGLALSNKILKNLNSELVIEKSDASGSKISFTLVLDTSEQPFNMKSLNLMGKRGLLVEDNPINIQITRLLLSKWNMDIDIATDGLQAINLLKERPLSYHIIFMDLHMPVMDGLEATQRIRESNLFEGPILAITAESQNKILNGLKEKGFTDFITKPVSPKIFAAKLLQYLK
ncbi:hybrid sensor histidine kinase/response regulator [Marinicellulosiphila megalodicopiae]|uniref:hybrid sensor histidine kinase/response regulator n=1 Tax=Marinicellulosiphila megalodicopiae TaxID=2724896 RepID=UPI003BAFD4BD